MKSYEEFMNEAQAAKKTVTKKDPGSSKQKCMLCIIHALKEVFEKYDIHTRRYTWEHLNTPKGKELMEKILRNPKTYLSDSEFVKLVEKD